MSAVSALKGMLVGCAWLASTASAQTYPNRPVKWLVGFAAGGPLDTYTRVLAQEVGAVLGQNVLVENRAGASG
jgi:tripartite-type tricarboxylate transporter receptor subunit TctC